MAENSKWWPPFCKLAATSTMGQGCDVQTVTTAMLLSSNPQCVEIVHLSAALIDRYRHENNTVATGQGGKSQEIQKFRIGH